VFPPQPQIAQTRAMLDRYAAGGGSVREVVLDGCGHGPPVERSAELRDALLAHIRDAG
jgi:pimeloyl-ACP methyl ester carboxylesterase